MDQVWVRMQITEQMAQERLHAAAVIDWSERVVYAVEKADYAAAEKALNVARINLMAPVSYTHLTLPTNREV